MAYKEKERLQARALSEAGKSYKYIAKELSVSISSVSLWCSDIAQARLSAQMEERAKQREATKVERKAKREESPKKAKGGRLNGKQVLTDFQVIWMRRVVWRVRAKMLDKWAKKYNVSINAICFALSGRTFANVDHISPPVKEKFAVVSASSKKRDAKEALFQELLELHRSDPEKWTLKALANWMTEKTGQRYLSRHVCNILKARDPSIVLPKFEPKFSEDVIRKAMALRRENPEFWTYRKLVQWVNDRQEANILGAHLKVMFRKRDPSMVELEKIKDPALPRTRKNRSRKKYEPKTYTLECVICEGSFTSAYKHREVCNSPSCREIVDEENRYTRRKLLSDKKREHVL